MPLPAARRAAVLYHAGRTAGATSCRRSGRAARSAKPLRDQRGRLFVLLFCRFPPLAASLQFESEENAGPAAEIGSGRTRGLPKESSGQGDKPPIRGDGRPRLPSGLQPPPPTPPPPRGCVSRGKRTSAVTAPRRQKGALVSHVCPQRVRSLGGGATSRPPFP